MEDTYTVIFNDDTKFLFTSDQLSKIPYFNKKINSIEYALIPENDRKFFNIMRPSIGFEYLHLYASLDEFDIIDPEDKLEYVIEQCKYFEYDKLKTQLESKFFPKTDIPASDFTIKSKDLTGITLKHHCTFSLEHVEYPCISSNRDSLPSYYGGIYGCCNESEIDKSLYKFAAVHVDNRDNSSIRHDLYQIKDKRITASTHMQYFKITLVKETINLSLDKEINEIYNKRHLIASKISFYELLCNMYKDNNNFIAKIKTGKTIHEQDFDRGIYVNREEIIYELLKNVNPEDYCKIEELYTQYMMTCDSQYILKEISCKKIFEEEHNHCGIFSKYKKLSDGRQWMDLPSYWRPEKGYLDCCRNNLCGRFKKIIDIYEFI